VGTRDLARAVEEQLGRVAFVSPAQAEVFIEGRVEPAHDAPGFRAHIELSDEHGTILGTRDLESPGPGCGALDEQLALVIALLIDPNAPLAKPSRPRAVLTPTPPPAPEIVIQRVPFFVERPPPPPDPWSASVAVNGALTAGLLPGVGGGLAIVGEITPPRFVPIELAAHVWLDAHAVVNDRSVSLSMAFGSLGACPLAWRHAGTRLRGCAAVDVGALRATGYGFRVSTAGEAPFAAVSLYGRVTQRILGPLELGLSAGASIPFVRAGVSYADQTGTEQVLFRVSPVGGVAEVGIGLAFP
jgi:hypothetical protein